MAAVIRIEIQSSGGVDAVKKDVAGLGDAAEGAGKKFSALGEIGIGALRAIGTMGVDLAVKGIQAIGSAISDGIEDAKQNAQIQAQTAAVIKSTGEAAGVSAQHVADYASSLSDAAGKSLFGDDQIQQSTNLLLTFSEIKGATLDAATAISVDMAQAMGGAPKDAAIQLGKALNDPIKGITALTRVGVVFSDEQKAQIQAMQEAGDMAGAQAVILAELNKEFGGSASAAADATGGWSEFNGRMGEAKETLGAAVLPLLNQLAGVLNSTILPIVENVATIFGNFVKSGGDIGVLAEDLQEVFGIDIYPFINAIQEVISAFQSGGLSGVIDVLITDIGNALPEIESALLGWGQALVDWITPYIPVVLEQLQGLITQAWAWIQEQAPGWGQQLLAWGSQIVAWIGPMIPPALAELGKLGEQLLAWIGEQAAPLLAKFQAWATSFVAWIPGATVTFLAEWPKMFDQFLTWIGNEAGPLLAKLGTWALQFIQWIAPMIPPFLIALAGVALAIATWIVETAAVLVMKIKDSWLPAIIGWIVKDAIPGLYTALESFWKSMQDAVLEIEKKLASQMRTMGESAIEGIKAGISSAWGSIKDYLHELAMSLPEWFREWWGIHSPSQVFANEIGAPVIQGLIVGIQGMIPGLTDVLEGVAVAIIAKAKKVTEKVVDDANAMQDALIDQAQGIADKLSGVMADALLGTASLDRAKAKAIGALKDISAAQQEEVQKQLAAAAETAGGFGDPKQAAAYFKQRSDQIFELAKLRDQIEKTTDEAAKARLIEQYNLIGKAQQTELQALAAKGNTSPLQAITEKLQALLANTNLPGALDPGGDVLGQLFAALPQLVAMSQSPVPSGVTQTNSSQFTYAPTVNASGGNILSIDYATAKALAMV